MQASQSVQPGDKRWARGLTPSVDLESGHDLAKRRVDLVRADRRLMWLSASPPTSTELSSHLLVHCPPRHTGDASARHRHHMTVQLSDHLCRTALRRADVRPRTMAPGCPPATKHQLEWPAPVSRHVV